MSAKPIALLVCGSRTWARDAAIKSVIGEYPAGTWLLHGDARGADRMAALFARQRGFEVIAVPYFDHLGRRGGPARNVVLVDLLESLVRHGEYSAAAEAFDLGTPGTNMMCALLASRGLPLRRHTP